MLSWFNDTKSGRQLKIFVATALRKFLCYQFISKNQALVVVKLQNDAALLKTCASPTDIVQAYLLFGGRLLLQ
jgi:hypothetical protein